MAAKDTPSTPESTPEHIRKARKADPAFTMLTKSQRASLDNAEAWIPQPGDTMVGVYYKFAEGQPREGTKMQNQGPWPVLIVRPYTADGSLDDVFRAIHAIPMLLRQTVVRMLKEKELQTFDDVCVTYLGKRESRDSTDEIPRYYHMYHVEMGRGETKAFTVDDEPDLSKFGF